MIASYIPVGNPGMDMRLYAYRMSDCASPVLADLLILC